MILYKYVSPERVDIIRDGLIRFTQPGYFNDPFEFKPVVKDLFSREFLIGIVHNLFDDEATFTGFVTTQLRQFHSRSSAEDTRSFYEKLAHVAFYTENVDGYRAENYEQQQSIVSEYITGRLKEDKEVSLKDQRRMLKLIIGSNPSLLPVIQLWVSGHMAQFSKEGGWLFAEKFAEAANLHIGVLSLSENWNNLLMWSHYAANHAGIVLAFRADHPFFNQKKTPNDVIRHLRRVHYSEERPQIKLTDLLDENLTRAEKTESFLSNFIYTKGANWKYEQEWRMLRELDAAEKHLGAHDIYLFRFPPDALDQLIVGHRASSQLIETVQEILTSGSRYSHVKLLQAIPDKQGYGLILRELEQI